MAKKKKERRFVDPKIIHDQFFPNVRVIIICKRRGANIRNIASLNHQLMLRDCLKTTLSEGMRIRKQSYEKDQVLRDNFV